MSKLKILIVFASALCAIAVSAAPASAEFESFKEKTTGSLKTGALNFEIGECGGGTGEWSITKVVEGKEVATTKGPKLNQSINFPECKIKADGKSFEASPINCELQVTEAGEKAGTESIKKCVIKGKGTLEGCEIALAGKEQKTVSLTNIEKEKETKELEVSSKIEAETKPNAACTSKKIELPSTIRVIWIEWQLWIWFFF
jgi:hypothetical protein